jgi:LysR family hydrogen peroxide-inducible transcriptional activator
MELRQLLTLLAVVEEGSFTAAADALHTVQSNVSGQVRQLEAELGVPLVVRSRRGAVPTEAGRFVLDRARRIRRELELIGEDLAALAGLRLGRATLGVVGTASRWLVPALVTQLRDEAPGVRLRISEGASERLMGDVAAGELAQAVVTEPVRDDRLEALHLLDETLVGLAPAGVVTGPEGLALAEVARLPLILPLSGNPLRDEIESAARSAGVELDVRIEVEGIRLIAELVAAGTGTAILPETALPQLDGLVRFEIPDLPPRRLALVWDRRTPRSRADEVTRAAVLGIVARQRTGR